MSTFVPRVRPKSKQEIEEEAYLILARHFPDNLESPRALNVLELWELLEDEYGLLPGVEELSDGVEGMTLPDGRVLVNEATYKGVCNYEGRPRFTMCHEAYHGLEHREQIENALVDTGELALFRRSILEPCVDPEWQANVFAASILMPFPAVKKVLSNARNKRIEDMMYYFRVSASAASIRIKELNSSPYYNVLG